MGTHDRPAVQLTGIEDAEFGDWLGTFGRVFGSTTSPETVERSRHLVERDRVVAARDERDTIVATSCNYTFEMVLPGGGRAPCAGVSLVAVRADHRRRGVLSAMMGRLLDDAAERGEPIAALWASETPIYGRFGFGPAAPTIDVEVPRDRAALTVEAPVDEIRLIDADEALTELPGLAERVAAGQPGAMLQPRSWWEHRVLSDPDQRAQRDGPLRIAWLPGRGFATYRVNVDWGDHGPSGRVEVEELVGTDPVATAALWRFVIDSDLTATTSAVRRAPDDPLLAMLVDQGSAKVTVSDAMHVRLVDVPTALRARRYATDATHVLEIRDPVRPTNEGRWRLTITDGSAEVIRTDDDPELTLDVSALATVWLGGVRTTQLLRAGQLHAGSLATAAALDRTFASDAAPWHGRMF